ESEIPNFLVCNIIALLTHNWLQLIVTLPHIDRYLAAVWLTQYKTNLAGIKCPEKERKVVPLHRRQRQVARSVQLHDLPSAPYSLLVGRRSDIHFFYVEIRVVVVPDIESEATRISLLYLGVYGTPPIKKAETIVGIPCPVAGIAFQRFQYSICRIVLPGMVAHIAKPIGQVGLPQVKPVRIMVYRVLKQVLIGIGAGGPLRFGHNGFPVTTGSSAQQEQKNS